MTPRRALKKDMKALRMKWEKTQRKYELKGEDLPNHLYEKFCGEYAILQHRLKNINPI